MAKTPLSIRIPKELDERIVAIARQEQRKVSDTSALLLELAVCQYEAGPPDRNRLAAMLDANRRRMAFP